MEIHDAPQVSMLSVIAATGVDMTADCAGADCAPGEVPATGVWDTLVAEHKMNKAQERVLRMLHSRMEAAGISREDRLVIAVDAGGQVNVGPHPQREQICAILAATPGIAGELRCMAALALTERGMRQMVQAEYVLNGTGEGCEHVFQACLKGGLSHFHLL